MPSGNVGGPANRLDILGNAPIIREFRKRSGAGQAVEEAERVQIVASYEEA